MPEPCAAVTLPLAGFLQDVLAALDRDVATLDGDDARLALRHRLALVRVVLGDIDPPERVAPCCCGCGEAVTSPDARGRARRFLHGHNWSAHAAV